MIYKHWEGYNESRRIVNKQTRDDDFALIDMLFGRDKLSALPTNTEVKAEALRQHEIEWRSEVDETATFWINVINA